MLENARVSSSQSLTGRPVTRSGLAADVPVSPVDWPDLSAPEAPLQVHPVAVRIASLSMRPLDLRLALATLRIDVQGGDGMRLRLAVEPLDPGEAQVTILRTHSHEAECPVAGCAVNLHWPAAAPGVVTLALRIEGQRVGMVPPALQVRASVVRHAVEQLDEAMTVRQITPRLLLPEDQSLLE